MLRSATSAVSSFSFDTDVDMRIDLDTIVATWNWIVYAFSSFPFETGLDVSIAFDFVLRNICHLVWGWI